MGIRTIRSAAPVGSDDPAERDPPVQRGPERHLALSRGERNPRNAPDEDALAERLAFDDTEALTELTEWLWQPLCRYAAHLVQQDDVARDIAQEAFVRLWEGRHRLRTRSLRIFLFRIARNLAFDHLKTQRTRRRLLDFHSLLLRRRMPQPDEVMRSNQVSREVRAAIRSLPPRRREVFVMAYMHSMSYGEIGEVLDISPKTVQHQMSAALAQLRRQLQPLLDERRAGHEPTAADAAGSRNPRTESEP